jgi:hypothetical protein
LANLEQLWVGLGALVEEARLHVGLPRARAHRLRVAAAQAHAQQRSRGPEEFVGFHRGENDLALLAHPNESDEQKV